MRGVLRRRLAVKGKILGRRMLEEVGTLYTPNTILRWLAPTLRGPEMGVQGDRWKKEPVGQNMQNCLQMVDATNNMQYHLHIHIERS